MYISDTVQVIPYSKHSVTCLKLVVDMVQPWAFHDGVLPRDACGQIEVLMDDGLDPLFFW